MKRLSPLAACSVLALGLGVMSSPALAQEVPPPETGQSEVPPPAPMPEIWAPVPVDAEGRSVYGLFLVGRLAATEGEAGIGADYLRRAQVLAPDVETLQLQAFTSSLIGGDLAYAGRLSPEGETVPPVLAEAGRLVDAVQHLVRGDAAAAYAVVATRPIGRPHARPGTYVTPYIAAAAGDWERALTPVRGSANDINSLFQRSHRAQLLEIRGDHVEAEAEYQRLIASRGGRQLFTLAYGEFLERRGRRADAVALYDATQAEGGEDPSLQAARARAAGRGRPPALLTLREGAAMALENAALQASIEGGHEFSAVYLRLAYALVPSDETLLNVGVSLAEGDLEVAARNTFARIGPDAGRYYVEARIQSALSYQEEDRPEDALAELNRAFAASPQDPRIAYLLAGQLAGLERYQEALALAEGPLLNTADQDFSVRFLRAGLYDALGRLDEAEAELWAALQARPDDPNILNYLGYIWVDSGRRIDQGAELIARAAEIDPGNANIQDSLGWARYQQGLYEQAVGILEGAVDGEPANAVINDHLGDAYWQVGRRREAVFQWNRVLTLEPDAELRTVVEQKLESGLPVAPTGSTNGAS
ncbi:MAG: tetratricopeptide repeat protein [Brevundimonas sp.]|uniref:tetratricopeptide repeat protein n=1 Tax=Brevundimonas sp. TaxID=1871086 RepID=UPI002ABA281E|nr:tetratricopeptide repeat protein [Brevundimonas sp.]MDZ4112141.1 tetratricopeptide repeat protein [Brevundimonas sp.]